MSNNRFGLHWANVPVGEQLGKWALGMGGDCYLVMDGGHGWIPKIREARPNAIIVHRHAVSNWMDMSPADWAREMADLFHSYKDWTRHVELECEPDIFPNFPGWGQPIIDRLKFAAEWNIGVAKKLRELCPGVIIHSAPLAHERIDLPQWFKIWKPLLDECDVLDMHCYWEKDGKYYKAGLYDPEESYHRAFRYRKIHDFLESQNYHIPMMVTECGNFAPDLPDYDAELIYYFFGLEEDATYMIGGCVFILKSNIHNWVNNLTRQPNVQRFFKGLGDTLKESLPYPEREPKEEEVADDVIRALDVSEWGGEIEETRWEKAYEAGFRMVVVQAWGGGPVPGGKNAYCAQQLAAARRAGMKTAIYFHLPCDTTTLTHSLIRAVQEAAGSEYQHILFVAVDIEDSQGRPLHPTDPEGRLANAISRIKDKPVIIYSSLSMWSQVMRGASGFESWPLWDARYDEVAELDTNWVPYGGWTQRAMKQYKGTTLVPGGISADLNIVDLVRLLGDSPPNDEKEALLARIAELERREAECLAELEEVAKIRKDDKAAFATVRNIVNDRIDRKD